MRRNGGEIVEMNSRVGPLAVVLFGFVMFGAGLAHAGPPGGVPRGGKPARAAQSGAPASGCALLPLSLVEEVIGSKFHDPSESKAMPAYSGAWGSNCEFSRMEPFPQGQDTRVDFMVFVEASAAEAKTTFQKAAVFFTDHSKPAPSGLGDSAYWGVSDPDEPTIHVLKGKVHFQLGMMYPPDKTKLLHLAAALAGRL